MSLVVFSNGSVNRLNVGSESVLKFTDGALVAEHLLTVELLFLLLLNLVRVSECSEFSVL